MVLDIPVVEVVWVVRYIFLFLGVCFGFVFCMHFLGCLVWHVLGSYLGIDCDMVFHKRVHVLGLRLF